MTLNAAALRRCRFCRQPLTDADSLRYRLGPDCRDGMTDEQLHAYAEQTKAERQPGYIPPQKPPSIDAQLNHREVQAIIQQAATPDICPDHGGIADRCAACRWEAEHPADRIIAEIRALTHEERRAIRVQVLRARYANVTPWRRPPAPPRPRRQQPAGPTQMELL